jgi:putative transposase
MSQSLTSLYVHVIFSTKNRSPLLKDRNIRRRLHAYIAGSCNNMCCDPLEIGGVEDHVHMLTDFNRSLAIANFVRDLKRETSKWIKCIDSQLKDFSWQKGYGAFSISPIHVPALKVYIKNQEEHHKLEGYKEEFRRLCEKYNAGIDERYCWD